MMGFPLTAKHYRTFYSWPTNWRNPCRMSRWADWIVLEEGNKSVLFYRLRLKPYNFILQQNDLMYGEEGTCTLCSKTFARKSSLLTHIRNHTAERKYQCPTCQKSKHQIFAVGQHANWDILYWFDWFFGFSWCISAFTQAANLRNHERIHSQVRPYVCGDCGKAFTQITNLNVICYSFNSNSFCWTEKDYKFEIFF